MKFNLFKKEISNNQTFIYSSWNLKMIDKTINYKMSYSDAWFPAVLYSKNIFEYFMKNKNFLK